MREVAAALRGKPRVPVAYSRERLTAVAFIGLKLTKAYTYLGDVKEHKQVIPFRRFNGGVGRASQAKQFGATQGGSSVW
jgi:large subunit ribosomal protein L17e